MISSLLNHLAYKFQDLNMGGGCHNEKCFIVEISSKISGCYIYKVCAPPQSFLQNGIIIDHSIQYLIYIC